MLAYRITSQLPMQLDRNPVEGKAACAEGV